MSIARIECQANSDWGTIVFLYKAKENRFPYHIFSGEVFNRNSPLVIRGKCVALVGLTPLVTLARSLYWLTKSIFMTLSKAFCYLDNQKFSKEEEKIYREFASDSVRALSYGVLLTKCALWGILNPYWARQEYGRLERELNRHFDGPHRDKFYLAICFQRIALMPQHYPQDSHLLENKLNQFLTRIETIQAAIFSCNFRQLMVEFKVLRPKQT